MAVSIGHDAGVAHGAGEAAQLDLPFFPDDVVHEWEDTVFGDGDAAFLVPRGAFDVGYGDEALISRLGEERRAEDVLAGLNPVGFGLEFRLVIGVVPEDDGVLFLEPFHVADWLAAGGVDGILLVDGADGDPVVVVSGDRFGRADGVGERDLEGGHDGVVPSAWDNRFGGGLGGVRDLSWSCCAEGNGCENHCKCAVFGLQRDSPLGPIGGI